MITTSERIELLKNVPVFQEMTEDELRMLSSIGTTQDYPDGAQIVVEGAIGKTLYVIVAGRVAVMRTNPASDDGYTHLATLEKGSYFAEMSLFDSQPASAHVLAWGPATMLEMQKESLLEMFRERPELVHGLFNFLCQRLRTANNRIAELEAMLEQK